MQWDLGLVGLGLLLTMALVFGLLAQVVAGRWAGTRLLWLVAATTYAVAGLLISEWWFGWATEEELQPNIDGLSFDEVLLIGWVPGVVSVLVTRYVVRHRHGRAPHHRVTVAPH
jgi:hypothetical protein